MDQADFRNRCYLPAVRRAQLRHLPLHNLRHAAASMLIASGADLAAISRQLGHANIAITLSTYTHYFSKRHDSGLGARLDAFLAAERGGPKMALAAVDGS